MHFQTKAMFLTLTSFASLASLIKADFIIHAGSCATFGGTSDGGFSSNGAFVVGHDKCDSTSSLSGWNPGEFFSGQSPCSAEDTLNFYPEGNEHVFYVAGGDGQPKGRCAEKEGTAFDCYGWNYSCAHTELVLCVTDYCK